MGEHDNIDDHRSLYSAVEDGAGAGSYAPVDEHLGLLLPDAHHLRCFLLERHSREKVRHAFLCWRAGVSVRWEGQTSAHDLG